jgi:hypothetical protein
MVYCSVISPGAELVLDGEEVIVECVRCVLYEGQRYGGGGGGGRKRGRAARDSERMR